jgi:hypothetical protein
MKHSRWKLENLNILGIFDLPYVASGGIGYVARNHTFY